ncbi:hypothetical protein [Enterococcus mediterraneensis]|nr:hypothetical protein [Enterococcus mediterraneensis]
MKKTKSTLLFGGSLILAVLAFSHRWLLVIIKGNKKGELKFKPYYYDSP